MQKRTLRKTIPFLKMHGAGNDFVVIDDFAARIPWRDPARISTLARRPDGIGCEGVILLQDSSVADFRMRFLNPDGSPAGMCGNGARCAAQAAHALGRAPRAMRMETGAGGVTARILGDGAVRIVLPGPWRRKLAMRVALPGGAVTGHFVVCGVPHFVVVVDDARRADVLGLGAALRWAEAFAPEGVNVDFVSPLPGKRGWRMRTYERGVEAETGACGTGAMAAALALNETRGEAYPVRILCSESYVLDVDRVASGKTEDAAENDFALALEGPTATVFRGEIALAGAGERERGG